MVPTIPPFFLSGRAVIPDEKKKTCLTNLAWVIVGQSTLVCSNANFLTFWIRIYVVAWDILEAGGLYKKVWRVEDSFMPLVIPGISVEKVG